jgi:hypothetical protein
VFGVAACLLLLLSACQNASVRSASSGDGVAYYLPKKLLKVTYTRTFPATDAAKRFAKAQAAVDAAGKAVAESKAAFEAAEARRKAADPSSPAYSQLEKEAAYLGVLHKVANETHVAAQGELASASDAWMAEKNAVVVPGQCNMIEKIEVTPTAPMPDTDQRKVAIVDHRSWRRDQVTLQTTKEGLLTSSSATITDESNNILVALFGSISSLRVGIGPTTFEEGGPKPTPQGKCVPATVEMTVDPGDLETVNAAIKKTGSDKQLKWEKTPTADTAPDDPRNCRTRAGNNADCGLFYRRDLPHMLRVTAGQAPGEAVVTAFPVSLPNYSPTERISLNATGFATNVHGLVFENGMLTQATTDQPSQLVAIAKLPTNIITGVLQSVATLVQLRVNVGTQNSALANQERALACALDKLEAAKSGAAPSLPASLCP